MSWSEAGFTKPIYGPVNSCFRIDSAGQASRIKCPKSDEAEHTWHLMTVTYGGTISLVSHLTHHEAEFMRNRLLGLPATSAETRIAAQYLAAQKKQAAVVQANDDAIIRKKAPACPVGAAKDPLQQSYKIWGQWLKSAAYTINLMPSICGPRTADACLLPGGSIIHFGEGGQACMYQQPEPASGDIKTAEIFQ